MDFIVDMQGFKLENNEFVLKELAVVSVNNMDSIPISIIFQPPCPWYCISKKYKSVNRWLEKNFHGISWNAGDVSYVYVNEILKSKFKEATTIYVKGYEKRKWLKNFIYKNITKIINMDDLNCPSIEKLKEQEFACLYNTVEKKTFTCALQNVINLKNWLYKNN